MTSSVPFDAERFAHSIISGYFDILNLKGGLIFMSKKSIAKKLFWNIAESSGDFHPSGEEYEEARKKRNEAESKLIAILPEGRDEDFRGIHGSCRTCRGFRTRGNLQPGVLLWFTAYSRSIHKE